ncbi:MAG: type II toxin-antitoxin system VapC family toxin [Caldilineales bacterium]|nr:type II toxin-antitoxin system VapC family toxin [Caldilineales bacterium]MCW5859808.1 type II toxin-antitoxin system VapC family toxin [Caldilineales bacterium]
MRALLDTHTFLWWNLDDPSLSTAAKDFIGDGQNEILLSAASAWEIAIKYAKGRLSLPELPERYIANRITHYSFQPLPIQLSHALRVASLPLIHHDPFDRLLIAQSQMENLPLLTSDPEIAKYDVDIIW